MFKIYWCLMDGRRPVVEYTTEHESEDEAYKEVARTPYDVIKVTASSYWVDMGDC